LLRSTLDAIRQSGLARFAGGFDAEVASQAVPLFGQSGEVIGALSIAVPSVRLDEARLVAFAAILRAGATSVTTSLGGVMPPAYAALWAEENSLLPQYEA
jgi:IclR family transcriptional regulator, acetate operon repressor